MKTSIHFFIISCSILLRLGNVLDGSCREIQNTQFMVNNIFFKNPAVNEIMWKNTVEPDKPLMTIWCMHIACWIPRFTDTHSKYVILIAFPLQQWLHKCTSMCALPVLFIFDRIMTSVILKCFRQWLCWLVKK